MARVVRASVLASGGFALLACGHGAETRGHWAQVRTERRCEALNPAYCLGLYGLAVRREGGFIAGPSDQGVVVRGAVSADELERLSSDVSGLSASTLRGAPSCDPGRPVPGIDVFVDVLFADQTTVRIVDNLCYLGGRDQALRLRDDLDALLSRYYPRPFP